MVEIIEKVAAAPAIVLEKGIYLLKNIGNRAAEARRIKKARDFWNGLGPGLVTGAADDDPSGIATYSQTGSSYGFQLLWLAGFTFPLMAIVQEMCARLGLVTGRGLAGNIRTHYPTWVVSSCAMLLFVANSINIGADLSAMVKATQLLDPNLNFIFLTFLFTFFSLGLQIFSPYARYAKYLKYLVLVLLSYVVTTFIVQIDLKQLLLYTIIPSITFSKDQLILITGILGTTISPYLFFWQTSHEVEEEILHGKTSVRLREGATDEEIRAMRTDVWSGMFISNLIMYFIIATCAAVLFSHGITNIGTAADAAAALKPLAGEHAFLLFAVGIIGMGLLAVPTLAGSAAYAVAENFKWRSGLHFTLHQARPFYGTLILSMLIGLAITFMGFDPIKLLIYTAVVNGLISPFILFLIVHLTSTRHVMKERVNHPLVAGLGWLIIGIMTVSGIATVVSLLAG
ncbi:Nramp family divalent metal transporter [Candidatus Gottesmanbacteria bacterium]|nr:Nramp family divalent metal transporter [Candidatus Gottesmanbacteria bacterium]